jgi:hypothetical protein
MSSNKAVLYCEVPTSQGWMKVFVGSAPFHSLIPPKSYMYLQRIQCVIYPIIRLYRIDLLQYCHALLLFNSLVIVTPPPVEPHPTQQYIRPSNSSTAQIVPWPPPF